LIVDYLIRRAKRTPYFPLPGYMERYWLSPPLQRNPRLVVVDGVYCCTTNDGTGPVDFLKRPLAWMMQFWLGLDARIHIILRSDKERDPHDHPTNYLTVILRNGYFEERYDDDDNLISAKWHGPGSVLFRRATDRHILRLKENMPATTLFVRGRKLRDWGFWRDGAMTPWQQYESRDAGR
jgi:hypothetical protein